MKVRFPWSLGPETEPRTPGICSIAPGAPGDPEPAPAPGGPAPTPIPPPPTPELGPDGKPWDPKRAGDTIASLRRTEDEQRRQLSTLQSELEEIRGKLKTHEDEKLSETEKLQARVRELEAASETAQTQLREQLLRGEVLEQAHQLGFADAEDALAFITLHRDEVRTGTGGNPLNVKEILAKALEAKPHLKATPSHTQIPGTPRAQNPPSTAEMTKSMEDELRKRGGDYARLAG